MIVNAQSNVKKHKFLAYLLIANTVYNEYINMDLLKKHEIIKREFKPKFEKLNLDF